jgi:hypothetical protein
LTVAVALAEAACAAEALLAEDNGVQAYYIAVNT